jgi:hypothetical protein
LGETEGEQEAEGDKEAEGNKEVEGDKAAEGDTEAEGVQEDKFETEQENYYGVLGAVFAWQRAGAGI